MSFEIDRPNDAGGATVKRSPVKLDYDVCEHTGVCALVCPEEVFEHTDGHTYVKNGQACTECWICVDNCVSAAIAIG